MLYNENEINMEPEKSQDQSDQRNICFESIPQECYENIINTQKNDLSFMRTNSNYELISQDSEYNENIYFNIRTVDNKKSLGEDSCEDKLLFSSPVEFNKEILPKLPVFYPVGKELLNKEIEKFDLIYYFIGRSLISVSLDIGKIFFNWCNALKKHFSNNGDMKKYFSKIEPIYFGGFKRADIYLVFSRYDDELNRKKRKKLSENLKDLGIVNSLGDDYLLPKLFEIFHEILIIRINNIIQISKTLENETLRKFFIRRIRDYIKYIKKNKNNLLLKLEQQKEEDIIFIEEFLKKKQPPFEFTFGSGKKYFQSHSLDFLQFIISRNIIILICRELMKEDDDYLKKVFKFKKYPKYYLKLKEALSLF